MLFFGDLNSRIDRPDPEVRMRVMHQDWDTLLVADQVGKDKSLGLILYRGAPQLTALLMSPALVSCLPRTN